MLVLAFTPAPAIKVGEALTKLRMLTAGARKGEMDTELTINLLMDLLGDYPADVTLETLKEWPMRKHGAFWPTWHELKPLLDAKASFRRAMDAKVRAAFRASI